MPTCRPTLQHTFFPVPRQAREHHSPLQRRERLGGLLKYYTREAAWL
jgi:hypothetical protein